MGYGAGGSFITAGCCETDFSFFPFCFASFASARRCDATKTARVFGRVLDPPFVFVLVLAPLPRAARAPLCFFAAISCSCGISAFKRKRWALEASGTETASVDLIALRSAIPRAQQRRGHHDAPT